MVANSLQPFVRIALLDRRNVRLFATVLAYYVAESSQYPTLRYRLSTSLCSFVVMSFISQLSPLLGAFLSYRPLPYQASALSQYKTFAQLAN